MTPSPPDAKGKNKRPADNVPTITTTDSTPDSPPRVLRRHHHRRRNVAASIWGAELPLPHTPTSSAPSTSQTPKPPFNIYKALLRHPNLFFQFALRLPYPLITSLYAIDKEFHYRLNKYSVSLIHDYTRYHAPAAGYIFSWVLYPELCISDPMLRPMDGRAWLARDVPGFRWVGMVLWRDKVVRGILGVLAREGHRVPRAAKEAVMKLWCVMEMQRGKVREAFLRDEAIWTDGDVLLVQLVLLKLDMLFADSVLGNGACALGHLLLSQKSLSTLWKVLSGRLRLDYDQTTEMVIRTYSMEDLDTDTHPWLDDEVDNGVPEEEWGLLSREGWHVDGARMENAVDMVIIEGIRRGLDVQQYYLDFVLYGYTDVSSGRNLPAVRKWRVNQALTTAKDGWPTRQTRKGLIAMLDADHSDAVKHPSGNLDMEMK
ncbi:hypothetical protein ACN47E_008145 [Coniothyrium glycines]